MKEGKRLFRVLVVDDEPVNRAIIENILSRAGYKIVMASNGMEALEVVKKSLPDLILLDVIMPGMDGFAVCRRLKADPELARIPIIFISAMSGDDYEEQGLEAGAVDYLTKPIKTKALLARVANHIELSNQHRVCEAEVTKRTEQLATSAIENLQALMRAAKLKDNETANHTLRVGLISYIIAKELGYSLERGFMIFLTAPLHDIGKLGVRDQILEFAGNIRERPELWEKMKAHTIYGAEIIGDQLYSEIMTMAYNIARYHHERCDGSGYPDGLKGEEIPLDAMIVAVADMIDAMLDATRAYRKEPIPPAKIREILTNERGIKLTKRVVDAAFKFWPTIELVEELFPNHTPIPFEHFSRMNAYEFALEVDRIIRERRITF